MPSLFRGVDDDRVRIGHVDFTYDHVCCHVWFSGPSGAATPKGAMNLAAPRGRFYDIDLSVAENGSLRLNVPNSTVKNVFEAAEQFAKQMSDAASCPSAPDQRLTNETT